MGVAQVQKTVIQRNNMNDLKYVIVQPRGLTRMSARAIIFNGLLNHASVVEKLKEEGFTLLSAGFLVFETDKIDSVKPYGFSSSLGLECDEMFDRIIILQTLKRMPMCIPDV